ncbi:MAG: hypothetical protein A3A94_02550 [Candidatus Portnoybacteria bacterium RIFCSPLOWO2_01_FULL_43_11]|uniref:Uncharacterized protein n=4 Tax=Candidatus Portnoyibacteriota TaxID=1817913 RepID=A0A1G2FBS6_9BACT|nr:MAG: hypothetical protein A2815_00750 [Candidatus Portnoybacteria bacterium RIFCSPHIGHO2_01_FULL_40_12b]OGZ38679.1 MAG: hypothetical protein A3A94_02550 [Candidatus Portnoybacteria bacterium RIFCSPLOWO2_01_FULL_43_11]OGZ39259.1 MAG: hypothetical protein A3E90_01090 [Candidatus Portnoybacteria bacterium RIFCSPHIGHO2_12_FULL_40_11]OGZ41048.1 MAG: hypothetical protein A3I20_01230 [Candidatus Portnoybacteria bacterium RIFCSPLOWO2_02_FULL_40_15]
MKNLFRNERFFAVILSIFISVFFVTLFVYGVTTIGTNVNTGGNLTVSGWATSTSATTTDYLYVGSDITEPTGWDFKNGDLIVSGATSLNSATTSDTLSIGSGSNIRKLLFGTCDIDTVTITASSSAYTDCQNATSVAAGDKVFVTATSSLPDSFVIQAASSTAAGKINIRLYYLGWNGATLATGGHTFYWQAIR